MDRFGPTGNVSKELVLLLRWTTFHGWTGLIEKWPFHSTIPTHFHSQCLTVRYFLGVNGGFSLILG